MKRFILRLLLIYTLISIIMIVCAILILNHDPNESCYPHKMLYVVNMTGDSISVSISGAYTKEEQRAMGDKPDEYIFPEQAQTLPYHRYNGSLGQAASFYIPHKHNTDIEFPVDFKIHIRSPKNEVTFNRNQFEYYAGRKYDWNWWVIYIKPHWLEPEVPDTTIFTSNGIRYRYLPQPGEVEVIHSVQQYKDTVFIPATVDHKGKTYYVTAIGDCAMAGDRSAALELINDKGIFKGSSTPGLRKVSFPDSLRSIGRQAFEFCIDMDTFTFPETLESIGEWAFEHCWSITSVTIPPRVSVIRVRAFSGCRNLERLTIPQTVTSIETLAFAQCRALKYVDINWQTPIELTEKGSPFRWVNLSSATLTVPVGTKQLYQAAPVWKEFGKIIEKR